MFLLMAPDVANSFLGGPTDLPVTLIGQHRSLQYHLLEQAIVDLPLTYWELTLEVCHVYPFSYSLSTTDFKPYQ